MTAIEGQSTRVRRMLVSALRNLEMAGLETTAASPPKSRAGKKLVAGHFAPDVAWQLRKLALDRDTTVQALLGEAIDDLFAKYHLPAR